MPYLIYYAGQDLILPLKYHVISAVVCGLEKQNFFVNLLCIVLVVFFQLINLIQTYVVCFQHMETFVIFEI